MKKAGRFLLVVLFVCVFCALGVAALAACGDEIIELSSIGITAKPSKTVYVAGESFDATGMEVTAYYSDGTDRVLAANEYDVRLPSMSVPSGKFKDVKSVHISYTEDGVEKTATLSITVTNPVTAVEILSGPDKTEYYPGERFDPTGLKINATFKNGSRSEVEITAVNAQFSATAITAGMSGVTVTYGEYKFDVDVTVKKGYYIEAEAGLLNGSSVGGSNYRELSAEEVSENVVKLYGAHLNVEYKKTLSDIKRAELIAANEANVEQALNAYLDSDEYRAALEQYTSTEAYRAAVDAYKNGTNADIAEWDYKADFAHYRAHGDSYLGELNKNDEVAFTFDSDIAFSGGIAFRISSTYLLKDNNGGWIPVEMGSVWFKELCEFYVNGVKAEIADGVKLEGGKTEDGSANSALWTNWKEVEFTGINFMAGRNVILLKMLDHKLVSPAQADNKAVPNIDGLAINTDDDVQINPNNGLARLDYDVTSVTIDDESGVALKVEGNISVRSGYVADIFNVKLGATLAELDINNGKFVATVNVEGFEPSEDGYAVTVCGKTLPAENISVNINTVTAYKEYKLDTKSFIKLIVSESVYSVQLASAEITPEVKLVNIDDKPYIVIGGGTYAATTEGFDTTDPADIAEIRRRIAAEIKKLYVFNAENNPANGGAGEWGEKAADGMHAVNILDDERFEIVCELSELKTGRRYGIHFNRTDAEGGDGKYDLNSSNFPSFTKLELTTLTVGTKKYEAFYKDDDSGYEFSWDCLAIVVSDPTVKSYGVAKLVGFEEIDGKPYAVYSGSCSGYTADELKEMITLIDYENSTDTNHRIKGTTYTLTVEDGKYYVKCDISALIVIDDKDGKNGGFYMHVKPFGSGDNGDISHADNVQSLTVGGYSYSAEECTITWDGGSWTGHIIKVRAV